MLGQLFVLALFLLPALLLALAFPALNRMWNGPYAAGLVDRLRRDAKEYEQFVADYPKSEDAKKWLRRAEKCRAEADSWAEFYRL